MHLVHLWVKIDRILDPEKSTITMVRQVAFPAEADTCG